MTGFFYPCRSMIESLFNREHIDTMRPLIQKTVDSLLDNVIEEGCTEEPVDFVAKFALPVPSYVSEPPYHFLIAHACGKDNIWHSWSSFQGLGIFDEM